ncbi:MAG TPA: DUF6152 family protein [Steroidobacteraceae bacterium]
MMNLHFRGLGGADELRCRRSNPVATASRRRYLGGLIAALITLPCAAHHSMAMFDFQKPTTFHGTVKELQWTNPHCFLEVLAPAAGATTEWSLEMHSPQTMYRLGWRPGSFKPGDKVTVTMAPVKDGSRAGMLISAIDASGRTLAAAKALQ